MSSSIMDLVMGQLGGGGVGAIAKQLGVESSVAKSGVETAIGVLTGVLAHNASSRDGASSLDSALAKDHDGSILDNVLGFLGDAASGPGAGILEHILGGSKPHVENAIAEKSGLSLDKVVMLLVTVAPLVMGAIGRMKREKALDANGVATTLTTEQQEVAKNDGDLLSTVIGMLDGSGGGGGGGTSTSSGGGLLEAITGMFRKKSG
ncbi:MAG TPA: DUF937 domain-containing protein [Acidimicrobiia bacterium]|nr:DUF937 domain-containing protein [Acidimicrobiia bacterium]